MSKELNNILNHSECPSSKTLYEYNKGKLNEAEAHAVEMHLIDCEMCSDELEGIIIFEENGDINIAVEEMNLEIDNLSNNKIRKITPLFNKWVRYAALIIVFIGLGFLINKFTFYNEKQAQKVVELESPNSHKSKENNSTKKLYEKDSVTFESKTDSDKDIADIKKEKGKEIFKEEISSAMAMKDVDEASIDISLDDFSPIISTEDEEEIVLLEDDLDRKENTNNDQAPSIPKQVNAPGENDSNTEDMADAMLQAEKNDELQKINDIEVVGGIEQNRGAGAVAEKILEQSKSETKNPSLFSRRSRLNKKNKSVKSAKYSETIEEEVIYIEDAKSLYDQNRYNDVLDIYYYSNTKKENNDNFFIGMSLFRLQKYEESLAYFDFTIKNITEKKEEAIFYKAKSLKKLNRDVESKALFNYLISVKSKFAENSSNILNNW